MTSLSRLHRLPSLASWIALAICLMAGAGVNVWRIAYWKTSGIHSPRLFAGLPEAAGGRPVHWARSVGRVEVFNQRWRPLRLTLTLRGPDDSPPEGIRVQVSADNHVVGAFVLHPSWSTHVVEVTTPAASDGRLWLLIETMTGRPDASRGFGFGSVASEPVLAARPLVGHGLVGAAIGAVAWLLLLAPWPWPPAGSPASATTAAAERDANADGDAGDDAAGAAWRRWLRPRVLVAIAGVLFLYFAGWALLRPPYQTADEPQHHLRTTSILRTPWVADPSRFALDGRYLNPLAYRPPAPIANLPFDPHKQLSAAEIAQVKATPWVVPEIPRNPGPFERVNASYPTLYYLTAFALAQPVTAALGLTPYQSAYVYRFATCLIAAILWTIVLVALLRTTATRPIAPAIVFAAVMNPMVAFLSSGVTPDAAAIPLCTLAMLAVWHVLTYGTHRGRTLASLLIAALVKPSAGPLIIALAAGIAVVWLIDRVRAARTAGPALIVVGQAGILAAIVFYLWSPLLFADQDAIAAHDALRDFVAYRVQWIGTTWIELWGRLGWLDTRVGNVWYALVFVLVLINLACVLWRPRRPLTFAVFAASVFAVFAATTVAGEFAYLPQAGYTLQGRYFLPAVLGLIAPILWHRVRAARYALLAGIVLLNVLLAQQTVVRYYQDGWAGVRQALPFVLP